jgi:hypothetical protein
MKKAVLLVPETGLVEDVARKILGISPAMFSSLVPDLLHGEWTFHKHRLHIMHSGMVKLARACGKTGLIFERQPAAANAPKYEDLQNAARRLYQAAGHRMQNENTTAKDVLEMFRAWMAVGDLIETKTKN